MELLHVLRVNVHHEIDSNGTDAMDRKKNSKGKRTNAKDGIDLTTRAVILGFP
jgi:hypothetical protein